MPIGAGQIAASLKAEAEFRERIAALGGVVTGDYVNNKTPVECICPAGHACHAKPNPVQQGQGMCKTCAGSDPLQAELNFRARVAELGGTVIGVYESSSTPVDYICRAGHACRSRPNNIQQGVGICGQCAANDSAEAELNFRAMVTELGGTVIGPYVRSGAPVECVCRAGHTCHPRPNHVQKGQGICGKCAGNDPAQAEAKFRRMITELGGTVIGTYKGNRVPIKCICPEGHACRPWPAGIRQGQGMCEKCAGREFTVYYIVYNDAQGRFKHGISSNEGKRRLTTHRGNGYTDVKLLLTGLPGDVAADIEDAVQAALRIAGIKPVQGREYYEHGLDIALDIATNYPAGELAPLAAVAALAVKVREAGVGLAHR